MEVLIYGFQWFSVHDEGIWIRKTYCGKIVNSDVNCWKFSRLWQFLFVADLNGYFRFSRNNSDKLNFFDFAFNENIRLRKFDVTKFGFCWNHLTGVIQDLSADLLFEVLRNFYFRLVFSCNFEFQKCEKALKFWFVNFSVCCATLTGNARKSDWFVYVNWLVSSL